MIPLLPVTAPNLARDAENARSATQPPPAEAGWHGWSFTGVRRVAGPFGRDQPEVARRVEVARAGVRLPARKLNRRRLRAAVQSAIGMRAGAERIARAFAAAGGPTAAAEALELLVRASETAPSASRTKE